MFYSNKTSPKSQYGLTYSITIGHISCAKLWIVASGNGNAIHPLNRFSPKSGSHAGFLSFPHSTHPVHPPSLSPPLLYISIPSTSLYPNYTYPDLNHCYFIPIRTSLTAGSTLALLSSIFHIKGFGIIYTARWSDPPATPISSHPIIHKPIDSMDFLMSLCVKNLPP